jgi:hypothetical protein
LEWYEQHPHLLEDRARGGYVSRLDDEEGWDFEEVEQFFEEVGEKVKAFFQPKEETGEEGEEKCLVM